MNNIITFLLAYLGLGICLVEHELFLTKQLQSKNHRIALLSINMLVSLFLIINITFGYLIWLRFGSLAKPINLISLDGDSQLSKEEEKALIPGIWSSGMFKYYIIEVVLNLISPYPWFWDIMYYETQRGQLMDFYLNTIFLTIMVLVRGYHFIRTLLSLSGFMDARAERITRIFWVKGSSFHQ